MAIKKKKNKKKINLYILGSVLTVVAFIAYGIVYIQSEISKSIIQTKIADLGEMQKSITKDVVIIHRFSLYFRIIILNMVPKEKRSIIL